LWEITPLIAFHPSGFPISIPPQLPMLIPLESPTKCYAISLLGKPGVLYHDIMMKPSPTPCPTPRHDWTQPQPAQRGATQDIPLPTSADFRHLRLLPGQLPLSDPLIYSECLFPSGSLITPLALQLRDSCRVVFSIMHVMPYWFSLSASTASYSSDDLIGLLSDDLCCSDFLKGYPSRRSTSLLPGCGFLDSAIRAWCAVFGGFSQGICVSSVMLRFSENLVRIRRAGVSGGLIGEGAFWSKTNPATGNGICCYLTSSLTPLPGLPLHSEVTEIAVMIVLEIRRVIACTALPESL